MFELLKKIASNIFCERASCSIKIQHTAAFYLNRCLPLLWAIFIAQAQSLAAPTLTALLKASINSGNSKDLSRFQEMQIFHLNNHLYHPSYRK